eukprot:scaffold230327_cov30-Tisochrysis_lutea.AAC.2
MLWYCHACAPHGLRLGGPTSQRRSTPDLYRVHQRVERAHVAERKDVRRHRDHRTTCLGHDPTERSSCTRDDRPNRAYRRQFGGFVSLVDEFELDSALKVDRLADTEGGRFLVAHQLAQIKHAFTKFDILSALVALRQ